jgi:hypothetical protein
LGLGRCHSSNIGAIATLYGTIFAATAGNSRVLADMFRLAGKYQRGDYAARVKYQRLIIWLHLVIPVCLFLIFRSPVTMVKVGGFAQALMLPVISVGTLFMRHRRPAQRDRARPSRDSQSVVRGTGHHRRDGVFARADRSILVTGRDVTDSSVPVRPEANRLPEIHPRTHALRKTSTPD